MDSDAGEPECRACLAGIDAPDEAPPEFEGEGTPEEAPCDHCRKRPRIEGSHLCVGCQLELAYALSNAGDELSHTPPRPLPSVSSPMTLLNDLEEKRARVAPSDVIVVGGVKSR